MIALAKPFSRKKFSPSWQTGFLALLPAIQRHAKIAFRHLDPEAREEAVQAAICGCCLAYRRLAELGKTDVAYPAPLARFAVAQVKAGRRTGGKLNCRDILSVHCQLTKRVTVERLDRPDDAEGHWAEILVEDRHAGPAVTAATRIDFGTWLHILPTRLRTIALFLARGETTTAAAQRFGLSAGRISQLRRQLYAAWHQFQGDPPAAAM